MKLLDRVVSPNEKGKTLADILKEHGLNPKNQNIQVWIDGKLTKVPPDKLELKPGWRIEIVPLPSGGGGGILGAVGAIAVGVLTGGLAAAAVGAAGLSIGAFTISQATVFALGFTVGAGIFSYLTAPKPKLPSFGDVGSDTFGSSPTYSWNGIQTVMTQGVPIPVVYGTHAVGGIRIQYDLGQTDAITAEKVDTNRDGNADILLITRKTDYNGNPTGKFAQPLQDWLLLCEGEIEKVETFYLNDIPYKSFHFYEMFYTSGTATNTDVSLKVTVPVSSILSHEEKFTYLSKNPSKLIHGFWVNLHFPNGLYKINKNSGGMEREPCKFKVRLYRGSEQIGESEEIPLYGQVKEGFVWRFWIGIARSGTPANNPLWGQWQFLDSVTNSDAPYRIEIEKLSEDSPTIYDVNTVYIQSITEELGKVENGYSRPLKVRYPYTAYLYYYLDASPSLSGTLPNAKVVVKGKRVKLYNFETGQWEIAWTDNPAWIIRDILTNSRYGLGDFITEENIDDESFKAFAQFCQEQGYKCNLVLDGFQRGWDLINNLLAKFRAFILRNGSKYKIKFLKDEPPVQMFTMGNVIQGSLKVHFISISDRYNTIEARFLDESDGYKMKTILVSTGERYERKKTIDFFGITDRATVEKECRFLLSWMQKVKRSIEFDVYLDALAVEPGDIFLFSHDVPKWLASGRIVKQEGNILTLDRTVAPETNYIKVRTKDDQILTFEIEKVEETRIHLKTSAPELENCPYLCGKISETPKLYRCIEITRTAENIRHVVAIEHIPELFN
ncbi:phage tail protein [Desulfurobacterium thermolithotrophum]|uniref:phage tail protein n=1 Tax=Desulfurobacterium thermolithotrophum TaxID=64160 RepID=UPI0013D2DF39|nr:phage tail protein [Desulfurobacterium thermolithotrophum]